MSFVTRRAFEMGAAQLKFQSLKGIHVVCDVISAGYVYGDGRFNP